MYVYYITIIVLTHIFIYMAHIVTIHLVGQLTCWSDQLVVLAQNKSNVGKLALKPKAMLSSIRYYVNNSDNVKSTQFTPQPYGKLYSQCDEFLSG